MRKKHKSIFLVIILIGAILLAIGLFYISYQTRQIFGFPAKSLNPISTLKQSVLLYQGREKMLAAAKGNGLFEEKVTIQPDENVQQMCAALEQTNMVVSGDLTCTYLAYSGKDRKIQPGNYTVPAGLNAISVADLVSDVTKRDKQFILYAGWRMEEVAEMVDNLGLSFNSSEFLKLVADPPEGYREQMQIPQVKSLEGYLFPGSYSM